MFKIVSVVSPKKVLEKKAVAPIAVPVVKKEMKPVEIKKEVTASAVIKKEKPVEVSKKLSFKEKIKLIPSNIRKALKKVSFKISHFFHVLAQKLKSSKKSKK